MPNQNKIVDKLTYQLRNYSRQRPFSSFLPGIAGPLGIPMWVFYTNRGQAITSFGIGSKDNPILEFQPANKAYRTTSLTGFRTFIKLHALDQIRLHEPFSPWNQPQIAMQQMTIGMNELEIEEDHRDLGLQTHVLYFVIPGEPFAGLVRKVTLTNRADQNLNLEVLDGLPAVIPFGVNNSALKEISRTIEAWMAVFNLASGVPFYRLQASADDTAEVEEIVAGHFALSFAVEDGTAQFLPPIVDPELVFGYNTALTAPDLFFQQPLEELLQKTQITRGKTPCSFFGSSFSLAPFEEKTIYTVFGHLGNEKHLDPLAKKMRDPAYLETKRRAANQLITELTGPIATHTALPTFDAYCRQTYLDNLLRGGWPLLLGDKEAPAVYHIYTRKHGDPERDYNDFNLAPEPYSRGAVNYRDVNQNRRSDVLFNPLVKDFNVRAFVSLIQADGYNPLVVEGVQFTLERDPLNLVLDLVDEPDQILPVLTGPFTPGQLLKHLADHEIELPVSPEEFLAAVLQHADHEFAGSHGEGFWVDHWTYNLDLIDSYLAIYPDRKDQLLFNDRDIPFFDSSVFVRPRRKKYVLAAEGPRQYQAVVEDPEKAALIASRSRQPNWVRSSHGRGAIYRTSLFAKLVLLAVIKFATLDPYGMGVEMEADKPGWYDALNGLPGIFGASVPETYALQELLTFLHTASARQAKRTIRLPVEGWTLIKQVLASLQQFDKSDSGDRDFRYWDAVSEAREMYREAVRLGFHGDEQVIQIGDLALILEQFLDKVHLGIQRATGHTEGVPPTYFSYQVEAYELITDHAGKPDQDDENRPYLRATRFRPAPLPLFLEGPVRAMRAGDDPALSRALYRQVKTSALFDPNLKMYKVNASLVDQPHDIGRARAFTPGWLENESIWLHMEYKYLLEVLRAGLSREFFEDFKNVLIPFQDPERYGRSPLENSSFLVSSTHQDSSLHGAGFVARLSGATAEFLSIWRLMMAGTTPFLVSDHELCLALRPTLPGWLFDEKGFLSFTFLGTCRVEYHNPQRADIFDGGEIKLVNLSLQRNSGEQVELPGRVIGAPYAEMVRRGDIKSIRATFQ